MICIPLTSAAKQMVPVAFGLLLTVVSWGSAIAAATTPKVHCIVPTSKVIQPPKDNDKSAKKCLVGDREEQIVAATHQPHQKISPPHPTPKVTRESSPTFVPPNNGHPSQSQRSGTR